MALMLASLTLALGREATAQSINLDPVLVFDDPANCRAGAPLRAILTGMFAVDPATSEFRRGGPITIPGLAAPIQPDFEMNLEAPAVERAPVARLAMPGLWHGLRVTHLYRAWIPAIEMNIMIIHFDDAAGRVRDQLNRAGFNLPEVGALRPTSTGPSSTISIQDSVTMDSPGQTGSVLHCVQ